MQDKKVSASVVDLFCGAGGLTHGFKQEGYHIAAGIDTDEYCRYAYERNNDAPFYRRDVSKIDGNYLRELFEPGFSTVLVGCAPCQPFSVYNQKNDDPQWNLLGDFARLIVEVMPDVISMENVPRLEQFKGGVVFNSFVKTLEDAGYRVWWKSVFAPDYGVPQRRTRLVLLASKYGPIELIPSTHTADNYRTVRDTIAELPSLDAGEIDPDDPLHRTSRLSELNMRRMKEAIPGGTWRDWSPELVTACHRTDSGRGYGAVYGRMVWDEPAPTITTQFYGFGNGRFGHPEQNRALSIREGAMLQTFPRNYAFIPPKGDIFFSNLGRLIGNAVPVGLGRAIARSIKAHLNTIT